MTVASRAFGPHGRGRLAAGAFLIAAMAAPALGADGVGASAGAEGIPFHWLWIIAPLGALAALGFAWKFYREVKAANPGDEDMQEIAGHVTEGAYAYLRRQYKVVAVFFAVVCLILVWMGRAGLQHQVAFLAFLTGGFFSGLSGWLGIKTATMAPNRTAQGAKEGLNRGLTVAFRAGAVMGLVVVGSGLLNITIWYLALTQIAPAFGYHMSLVEVTVVMLAVGMGASAQALFARVGGGIFTKAADVGADLVGKVEADIPEDDPRNPATIADNVGDNVGDVAGMGADLYESYCGSILATSALGVAAAASADLGLWDQVRMLSAPMALAGVGILLSILGVYMVRTREGASMKQLMGALGRGANGSSVLIVLAALGVCWVFLHDVPGVNWWGMWLSIVFGLCAGVVIGKSTEYYTSYDFKPTQGVSESAQTGAATVIISGVATGMKSTWAALLTVIVAIVAAYGFAGGFDSMPLGLYGVGIAAVGMLSTLGITLASDAYGPIADNAGGNAEMSGQDPEVRRRTDALDSVGNTTAAIGKGFAIGSAAMTAMALLAAYVEQVRVGQQRTGCSAYVAEFDQAAEVETEGVGQVVNAGSGLFSWKPESGTGDQAIQTLMVLNMPEKRRRNLPKGVLAGATLETMPEEGEGHYYLVLGDGGGAAPSRFRAVTARRASLREYMDFYQVTVVNPKVLGGLFAGVLLVFLFSSLTMRAVGRAAQRMIEEVRRQFRQIAGIMDRTAKPDYARCVAISTAGAQREMVLPSLLALIVPVGVGLVFGVGGVLGLLAGGLTSGFAMAIFMANAGGAWDNAKKYIEAGHFGGKGSDNHKATVVGDTVGDPFKDTSGPSLNILIKLMSMVSVVFAGLVVKYSPQISHFLHLD